MMQVTLEVPEDVAQLLGGNADGLTKAALEALALEGVRSGKLTVAQARRMLRIASRDEMDGFLKAHGVLLPLTLEDISKDARIGTAFLRR